MILPLPGGLHSQERECQSVCFALWTSQLVEEWPEAEGLQIQNIGVWCLPSSFWEVSFFKLFIINCARRNNWALTTPKMHRNLCSSYVTRDNDTGFPNRHSGCFREMYSATSCWNLFYTAVCNKYCPIWAEATGTDHGSVSCCDAA